MAYIRLQIMQFTMEKTNTTGLDPVQIAQDALDEKKRAHEEQSRQLLREQQNIDEMRKRQKLLAEQEVARDAKKKQREQKSKQSADNGGAAVSAASGASAGRASAGRASAGRASAGRASAGKPALGVSSGGKRAVGAPRKCPTNKSRKRKETFVSHAVQKAAEIASYVQKFQHFNAEEANKEINKVKEAICRDCVKNTLMKLEPHGPDGTDFTWICPVCQVQSNWSHRSHILTAFAKLGYKILDD